jgi:hypothetical protein
LSEVLILSALNTGSKTVTMSSMGLILPDKKYLFFVYPTSDVTFPYELAEGKNCKVWTSLEQLAKDLKKEGFSGNVKLIGFYRDAIDNKYRSKPLKFNVDR